MSHHPSPVGAPGAGIFRPCARPGCRAYAAAGGRWCTAHAAGHAAARAESAAQADRQRGSAAQRGYDRRWQKARRVFLALRAYRCAGYALAPGAQCLTPAGVVDHITPHRGDPALFWSETNWQPLCKRCHDRKTATEDGGFRGSAAPSPITHNP